VDSASPGEFQPYQNATFLAADGADYWQDIALPFTNDKAHCKQIARVLTERARNSQIISYPAKLRAWPLQVGDRVTVTSTEYGITTPKPYRVTDWQFGLRSPVTLLLQEDAADAYDTIDAVDADPTPNTDLPQPWTVEAISLNTPESGTNHLVQYGDGTIAARVWVSWASLTGAYLRDGQGRVVVRWRRVGPDVEWQQAMASADDDGIYLPGMVDGDRVVIEAWAMNALGFRGDSDWRAHTVVGKAAAPANVSGLSATAQPGGVLLAWTANTELDQAETELRQGASWAAGTTIYKGWATSVVWAWPAAGSYTVRAKHRDTSGNESASDTTTTITVGTASLINTSELAADAATKVEPLDVATDAYTYPLSFGVQDRTFTDVDVANSSSTTRRCEVTVSSQRRIKTSAGQSGLAKFHPFVSCVNITDSLTVSTPDTYKDWPVTGIAAGADIFHEENVSYVIDIPAGKTYRFTPYARVLTLVGSTGTPQVETYGYSLRAVLIKA